MIGIYKIENIINHKVYIGQAADISDRWKAHKELLNRGVHHNNHLQAAWNKYGEEKFTHSTIQECNINELDELEQKWIESYKESNGVYNQTLGGQGTRGRIVSSETRKKISDAQRGKPRQSHSEETRRKISISNKGKKRKPFTPEQIARMSQSHKGQKGTPLTKEHKAKLIEANTGRACTHEHKLSVSRSNRKLSDEQVISIRKMLIDGVTQKEIANTYNVDQGTISKIKNNRLMYGGALQ
jgi:group I intron endonuclease